MAHAGHNEMFMASAAQCPRDGCQGPSCSERLPYGHFTDILLKHDCKGNLDFSAISAQREVR